MGERTVKQQDLRDLSEWYSLPFGTVLKSQILRKLQNICSDLVFDDCLHIGIGGCEEIHSSQKYVRPVCFTDSACEYLVNHSDGILPLKSYSMDAVVLMHGLDVALNPHGILREVDRVITMDGHLVIIGFNPFSLWGTYRPLRNLIHWNQVLPWKLPFYKMSRLRDWLKLLNFSLKQVYTLNYSPVLQKKNVLSKFAIMNPCGAFLMPRFGNVYIMLAQKRAVPLIPMRKKSRARRAILNPGIIESGT